MSALDMGLLPVLLTVAHVVFPLVLGLKPEFPAIRGHNIDPKSSAAIQRTLSLHLEADWTK